MAVATGVAEVVVCYRAFNERSGHRFGQVSRAAAGAPTSSGVDNGWHYPMGLGTPAATVAMVARRYQHVYGATSEDFGRVAVADRRHAATNPQAWFYRRPDHARRAPGVAVDRRAAAAAGLLPGERRRGGTGRDERRAGGRACRQPPAVIRAAAQGSGTDQYVMTSYYRDDLTGLPEMGVVGRPPVASVRFRARGRPVGGALRPLHAVRADAAGGAGVLPARRGAALHRRRRRSSSAAGCRSTPTAGSSARRTSTA